jgi:putative transcriptional regulator
VTARERRLAPVDVRRLRERIGLSQEDFALKFNLDLSTLQGWEQGRRAPDRTAENYLRVIDRAPDVAADVAGVAG